MLRVSSSKTPVLRLINRLAAAGLPRAIQHMLRGDFAIFTASRGEHSSLENKQRMIKLKEILRERGYGFMKTFGAWTETDLHEGIRKWLSEDSLFVPNISEEETKALCEAFGQEAYVWGSQGTYWIKSTSGQTYQAGPVQEHFRIVNEEKPGEVYTGFEKDPRTFTFDTNRGQPPVSVDIGSPSQDDRRVASARIPPLREWFFFSLEGNPKYVNNRFGIKGIDDRTPDPGLCDAWLPLREQ